MDAQVLKRFVGKHVRLIWEDSNADKYLRGVLIDLTETELVIQLFSGSQVISLDRIKSVREVGNHA